MDFFPQRWSSVWNRWMDKNRIKIILILTYYPVVRKTIKKLLSYRCHHFFFLHPLVRPAFFKTWHIMKSHPELLLLPIFFYINTEKIHADFKKSLDDLDSWVLFQMELACVGTVPNVIIQANTSKTTYFYLPRTGGKKKSVDSVIIGAPTHAIYMISRPWDIL